MKLKTLTLAVGMITFAQICFAVTNHVAIGVSEILHRVETATTPTTAYHATAHQPLCVGRKKALTKPARSLDENVFKAV